MRQTQIVNFELTLPFALLRVLLNSKYGTAIKCRKIWGNRGEFGSREKISLCNKRVLISLQPP